MGCLEYLSTRGVQFIERGTGRVAVSRILVVERDTGEGGLHITAILSLRAAPDICRHERTAGDVVACASSAALLHRVVLVDDTPVTDQGVDVERFSHCVVFLLYFVHCPDQGGTAVFDDVL